MGSDWADGCRHLGLVSAHSDGTPADDAQTRRAQAHRRVSRPVPVRDTAELSSRINLRAFASARYATADSRVKEDQLNGRSRPHIGVTPAEQVRSPSSSGSALILTGSGFREGGSDPAGPGGL